MPHRFLSAVLVAIVLSLGAEAGAQPSAPQAAPPGITAVGSVEGIHEYRLPNGLQVLLVPDDSKPTTTVNMTYHVGSRHESYGETGMAHLLEHLLFKGTPTHRNVMAEFTRRGLRANGSTWVDRTNYFASFSANPDNLKWYLGWQADAMVNSLIARSDLDTEMTVVRNEMESGENQPGRVLFSRTLAAMFDWHNYGKGTIGARSDVENVDIPRLQAFYRTYYQPDNATLIVAGKFDNQQVLRWIIDDFGKIPRPTRTLPEQYTLDPAQDGERAVTVRRVGGVPLLYVGYHVPPAAHPDYPAIELLATVFGDTPSGRLHKRLTEGQLAASTFAFAEGLAEPGFMLFGAQLAPKQDITAARTAMVDTLESVAKEPITEEEARRARVKWLKDWQMAFSNPEKVGVALSESIAQGDWRLFFLMRDRIEALKASDLQRVAEQRLLRSNRTVGTYVPTEDPQRAPAPSRVDVQAQLKSFHPEAGADAVAPFEATPAHIEAMTQRFQVGGIEVALLPKATRGGAVRAVLTLRFGDVQSLAGHASVPDMAASMLEMGTRRLSRQQIQDRLDELMAELSIVPGTGRVTVRIATQREHLPGAIALAGELLREPSFPADALDELKRQGLASVEASRKEPGAVAGQALAQLGDPYPRGDVRHARSFDEMAEDIRAVTVEKLRDFHARFYGAREGQFGASGDMDVAAVRQALQAAFGDWTVGAPYTRVPEPLVPIPPKRLVLLTPDKQNAVMLARLPLPLSDMHQDYPALMLANYLLGSGGNSRLWERIREKEGLSYDVGSGIDWSSVEPHSDWNASAIFAPQNRARVESAFREEVSRALKDGFTAQEVEEGKRGLLNYRRLSRAQDPVLAAMLANNLYLDRDFLLSGRIDEALEKLTPQQVNEALRRYIRLDAAAFAFGGDFKPE